MWHSDDTTAHTFIVRLWMEDPDEPGVDRWRGHVTHLIDEDRMYVSDLDEIVGFIRRHLEPDGGGHRRPPAGRTPSPFRPTDTGRPD